MANIQERRDKNGKLISYSIRVFRGRDASGKQSTDPEGGHHILQNEFRLS